MVLPLLFVNLPPRCYIMSSGDMCGEGGDSPSRFLSASERLDMFAVKVGMTEPLLEPENVKRKGHT